MIYEHASYRTYLTAVLAERVGINPSYSLRTLAMELGLAHSSLSEILRAKKNLSPRNALRVGKLLELAGPELEYFLLLVQSESTKDADLKDETLRKLSALNPQRPHFDLSADRFKTIADWYHLAVLAMTDLEDFTPTPAAIAERLDIAPIEATAALERLERLELIERDESGRFRRTRDYVVARSDRDEPAIRRFNEQMLRKALDSLRGQPRGERFGGTETFGFSRARMPEAEALIDEFLTRMAKLCENDRENRDVYHLNVQFFNLTPNGKKGRNP